MSVKVQIGRKRAGGRRLQAEAGGSQPARPLISVITVTLNAAATLERTIRSVIEQSFDNIEYLIVDGGSTDATLEILSRYDARIDYWISEPDRGIYDAMNKAVGLARGQWLYFLGADDILLDCLSRVAPLLIDSRCLYYGDVYMPVRHRLYRGCFSRLKLAWTNICQQAIFYPRGAFQHDGFNLTYPLQADWEFNMRCQRAGTFRFSYIPILVAIFNDRSGRTAITADERFNADYPVLLQTNFAFPIALGLTAVVVLGRILRRMGLSW